MRYIDLRYLSKCLKGRRNNPPDTTLAAKKAWRRSNKKDIRKACYKQQHGLCAYTELSLEKSELGCHLEHIAPRSFYPERTFLPHNIVLSIMDDIKSGTLQPHEKFGGHHKSEEYSDDWFISPFNRNCAAFFEYQLNGLVQASAKLEESDRVKAERTISVLNLNAAYLVERRQNSLELIAKQLATLQAQTGSLRCSNDFKTTKQHKETTMKQFAEATLKSRDRKLPEFYSAKKQFFENIGVL